jgi:hypothetical protein
LIDIEKERIDIAYARSFIQRNFNLYDLQLAFDRIANELSGSYNNSTHKILFIEWIMDRMNHEDYKMEYPKRILYKVVTEYIESGRLA